LLSTDSSLDSSLSDLGGICLAVGIDQQSQGIRKDPNLIGGLVSTFATKLAWAVSAQNNHWNTSVVGFENSRVEICDSSAAGGYQGAWGATLQRTTQGGEAKASLINANSQVCKASFFKLPNGDCQCLASGPWGQVEVFDPQANQLPD
jgi:hypothetical protein